MKIGIITLGCKVNQYESGAIKQELEHDGFEVTMNLEPCDIYVLNTCAVTGIAEKKSRAHVAKLAKLNPNAKVIVCGCASEHSKEQFSKKTNVVAVIGTYGKNKIPEIISAIKSINLTEKQKIEQKLSDFGQKITQNCQNYEEFAFQTRSRTRAYLKIQDGCNNFCSYCLIPYVRGRSRSRSIDSILNEAKKLSETNKEIILTGINISDFQIDGKPGLKNLFENLKEIPCRFRISSFENGIIDDELLKTLASMPNFCPHFHLSMQSGANRILKLMNRHYTTLEFLQRVELIKKYFPNAAITTDVIVGFPTETDEDFAETIETIKKVGFYEMHIFPYSKRDGTAAARLKMVDGNVVNKRVKVLEEINKQNKTSYIKSQTGILQCLTENIEDDYVVGYTENYIKIYLPKDAPLHEIIKVKNLKIFKDGAKAEIT